MSEQFYIGFGSGIKLLSEDWYIKEFGTNITKKAFRSFCRALKVPLIEMGKTTYVEMNSFQLALKAITRVGEEDFYVSGCQSIATGKQKPSKLDPAYVAKNLEPLLCELLACKTMGGLNMTTDVKKAAQKAAYRMARAGLAELPEEYQNTYTKKSIRVFGDITKRPGSILDLYEQEELNEEPDTGDDPEDNS
jgi:hypothetical protein